MGKEIERKFLLKSDAWRALATGTAYRQGYLNSAKERTVRIRTVGFALDITDRKRAERRIRYLARYDALTKIPNRMQFQHMLQQAIARTRRTEGGIALLYLDMDQFKEINDTFGHAAGDALLVEVGRRLRGSLREVDTIARAHLADVERKLADLTRLASELREVIGQCGCGSVADCRIIESLSPLGGPA